MPLILVHEPKSHWTAELERKFAGERDVVFRWRPDSRDFLEEAPQADLLLAVVTTDDAGLDFVRHLRSTAPFPPLVCLTADDLPRWEFLARELGVEVVHPRIVEIDRLAASLSRLLSSRGASVEWWCVEGL